MKRFHFAARLLAFAAFGLFAAQFASAQATRTWVSGTGDDANPCSLTAACKTFAGAISKTAAGGEISVLDPGGYGSVTITKSLTISGDGTLASILHTTGTNGIMINAGAGDVVQLRNLSITGGGNGANGIRILAGALVVIDRVTIADQTTTGIDIAPSSLTAPITVVVRDTAITNVIDNVAVAGIRSVHGNAGATAGLITLQLENVRIQGVESTVTTPAGVLAGLGTSAQLDRVTINRANTAVSAPAANSVVYLSDSTITHNATGLAASNGGQIISYNNNRLRGNTTNGAPTSTVYTR